MRQPSELLDFLVQTMSMTDVYQPAIILHLLEYNGEASKTDLARVLSGYDESIQEYYEKVVMRWPKITLTKHDIVSYNQKTKRFTLNFQLNDPAVIAKSKEICEQKIRHWIDSRVKKGKSPRVEASVRYRILKAARGKCELCGISSKITPIDIDHIVPQSYADSQGYIVNNGISMHVHDERNLQSLCFRCNRAKRDQDATDFRATNIKILRDGTEWYMVNTTQTVPRKLKGEDLLNQLFEKLIENHVRLIDKDGDETVLIKVTSMIEVLLSIAEVEGFTEDSVITFLRSRKESPQLRYEVG